MSRLRKLKERKRRNRIKATSYGLVLALFMGAAQGLGTYALFTDNESISNNIAVSTGDVDVEINGGKYFTYIKPGDSRELDVKITNKGTLSQNIKLELSSEIKDYVSYKFNFDGVIINKDDGIMYNNDGGLFVLAPGSSIEGVINITVNSMDENIQNELAGNKQKINLTVTSRQINSDKTFSTKGFYDVATQVNTIIIAKPPTIEDDNILESGNDGALKVTPANKLDKENHFFIKYYGHGKYMGLLDIIDKLDGDLKVDPNNITIFKKYGAFANSEVQIIIKGNGKKDPIAISADPVDGISITENFEENNYIDIKIDYENGISKIYRIDFRAKDKQGNRLAEAKVTLLDTQVIQEDESLKEETEAPSKPEVIEPPKEEVDVPSKPEVVEPQKEETEEPSKPEVVNPPKEEIEVPNNPEVVEPPKENEELQ